jgi:hypothetical protein
MAMTTDNEEDAGHCEQFEHFFALLWAGIPPSINASVNTFRKLFSLHSIELVDIKPSNFLVI